MKRLCSKSWIVFLLAISSLAPISARADRWGHHEGMSRFSVDADYFQSSQNFNNRGNKQDIPLGGKYREVPVRLGMRHDPDSRFSFFGELGVNSIGAENTSIKKERTALSNMWVGADFQLIDGPISVIPEFKMTIPLSMIDRTEAEAFVGEGVFAVQTGVYVSKIFKYLWLSAYGGFDYRMGGRASLGLWNAMARFRFWSLFLDAEVRGSSVMLDDDEAFYPDNRFTYINAVNAGSYRYYSVNPEFTEVRAALGIQMTSGSALRLGFGQSINGYRSSMGQTYLLSFQMDFGDSESGSMIGGPDTIPVPVKAKNLEPSAGRGGGVTSEEEEAVRSKTRDDLEKELEDFVPEGMEESKPRRKRK